MPILRRDHIDVASTSLRFSRRINDHRQTSRSRARLLLFFALASILWLDQTKSAHAAAANGYGFSAAVTVAHGQVPNSDQANFPVLFSGTYPALATTSNGGHVSSSNGYDIIFTSDAAGNNKLNFERASYSANGQVAFWIQLPNLSHSADTTFYIFYGNSSVTTDTSNKNAVWSASYTGVWHMADNASTTLVTDSTANDNNGHATANTSLNSTAGKVGAALKFNGIADAVTTPASSSKTFTWEAWVNSGALANGNYQSLFTLSGSSYMLMDIRSGSGSFWSADSLASNDLGVSGLTNNTWYHLVFVRSGDNSNTGYTAYLNGARTGQAPSGTWNSTSTVTLGSRSDMAGQNFSGILDEVRVSSVARSSDWISTEFNNQSNPAAFYSVAWGVTPGTTTVTSTSSSSGTANGYGFNAPVTVAHGQVPNSDQANFPVLFSGTYPALATTSNGGHVSSSNGYDIIFTSDAAGNNKLNFERASYSANGQVAFWIQLPNLSHSADTTFYIFYGNSSVTTDTSNKNAVWSASYTGVWHMADNASTTLVTDSTANDNNGHATANTSLNSTAGKVGAALKFNGIADAVTTPASSSKTFTWEAWVNSGALANGNYQSLFTLSGSSYMLMDIRSGSGSFWSADSLASNDLGVSGLTNNTWYHLVFVRSGDNSNTGYTAYLNGARTGQAPSGTWNSTSTVTLGSRSDMAGQNFSGILDEVRVSSVARSSDWISTEFNNQSNPAAFYSVAWGQLLSGGTSTISTGTASTGISTAASTTVSLPVVAPSSTLTANLTSIAFGNVNVNSSSSRSVMLTNNGTATVTISQVGISGLGLSATGLVTPFSLAPGQSTTLTITFAATTSGAVSGNASIASNATNPSVVIGVTGTGVQPQIAVSPSGFNFGNVNTGSVGLHSFGVTNTGNSSLTISNASVAGSSYTLSGLTLPMTLNPGQGSSFNIQFTPTAAGSLPGSLTLTSNSSNPATITLSGTGVAAPIPSAVLLSWNASTSAVVGYNVYSSLVSGGPYTKLTSTPVASPSETITNLQKGTYYYVVTAVSANGMESGFSDEVSVLVP